MEQINNLSVVFFLILNKIFNNVNLTKDTKKYRREIQARGQSEGGRGGHVKPVGLQRQLSREEQKSLNCAIANGPLMQK